MAGMNILTDPMWSERASPVTFAGPKRWVPPGVALEALPPLDLVLLSHNHYDHLDDRTVRALVAAHPAATWAVPLGLAGFLRERGAARVLELDWWQEAVVGPTRVTCVPAQHFSARGIRDRDATLWCAWALRSALNAAEGGRAWSVFFGGDSGLHPDFGRIGERLGPFDLTLLPIGAYDPRWFMAPVHMAPEEAVEAFTQLNRGASGRAALLPIHWGTFKLTDEAMDEPPRRLRAAWKRTMGEEPWLLAHGETRWW
jgi:N-acyl-phosphatidylethanolamine-hydrolysing phospholipase D